MNKSNRVFSLVLQSQQRINATLDLPFKLIAKILTLSYNTSIPASQLG